MLALCLLHGATFLTLKTTDQVRARSRDLALKLVWPVGLVVALFAGWTVATAGHSAVALAVQIVALLAVVATYWLLHANRDGWAFVAMVVAMAAVPASLFMDLYPNVLVSSTKAAYTLTVSNSAAGHYALQVFSSVTKSPAGQNFDSNSADTDTITGLVKVQLQPMRTWDSLLQRSLYHAEKLHDFAHG